jgi:hypothetical protein
MTYGIFYSMTKKPIGYRFFTDWREIKRGKGKGKLEVLVKRYGRSKKIKIDQSQVKRFPHD